MVTGNPEILDMIYVKRVLSKPLKTLGDSTHLKLHQDTVLVRKRTLAENY